MRKIKQIIVHCSATKEGQDFKEKDIKRWHLERGFNDIGYHYVVDLDGTIEEGRSLELIGAHTKGQNRDSIGICYVGGLDASGEPKDTRTTQQKAALWLLINKLRERFGNIPVYPHYKYAAKACPCFPADKEYN